MCLQPVSRKTPAYMASLQEAISIRAGVCTPARPHHTFWWSSPDPVVDNLICECGKILTAAAYQKGSIRWCKKVTIGGISDGAPIYFRRKIEILGFWSNACCATGKSHRRSARNRLRPGDVWRRSGCKLRIGVSNMLHVRDSNCVLKGATP